MHTDRRCRQRCSRSAVGVFKKAVVFQGHPGLAVGAAVLAADGQRRTNAFLARRGDPVMLELRVHATPDSFRERDPESPRVASQLSVLGFGELYLSTHHDVTNIAPLCGRGRSTRRSRARVARSIRDIAARRQVSQGVPPNGSFGPTACRHTALRRVAAGRFGIQALDASAVASLLGRPTNSPASRMPSQVTGSTGMPSASRFSIVIRSGSPATSTGSSGFAGGEEVT